MAKNRWKWHTLMNDIVGYGHHAPYTYQPSSSLCCSGECSLAIPLPNLSHYVSLVLRQIFELWRNYSSHSLYVHSKHVQENFQTSTKEKPHPKVYVLAQWKTIRNNTAASSTSTPCRIGMCHWFSPVHIKVQHGSTSRHFPFVTLHYLLSKLTKYCCIVLRYMYDILAKDNLVCLLVLFFSIALWTSLECGNLLQLWIFLSRQETDMDK